MTDPYRAFLERKVKLAPAYGRAVGEDEVNPLLKPHQRDIVRWAVAGGRRAIFAAFGLGKTAVQMEACRLLARGARDGGPGRALIVAPLGVRAEFVKDAALLNAGARDDIDDATRRRLAAWHEEDPERRLAPRFIRRIEEADETGLYVTNYETVRDGKLDPAAFDVASLDEAAVLRSYGSKTYQSFLGLFSGLPFRLVATAMPSPNRYKELIHYAGFLGIMDTGQALTRFFQRDSSSAGNLTLYPHKEREFWLWLASWAVFVSRPSDLGHEDAGYDLPPLAVVEHEVRTAVSGYRFENDGQGRLVDDASTGVREAAAAKRDSLGPRIEALKAILAADPDSRFVIWHDLEAERHAIAEAVPEAVAVYGTQDLEERERVIADFSEGRLRYLSAKPIIAGSGTNLQRHCHKAVFLGIGHKFHDFLQSIHRIRRFLQTRPVEVHVIYADTERELWRGLRRKWKRHEEMVETMTEIVRKYGLNHRAMAEVLTRSIGIERVEAKGEGWLVANNDCVEETKRIEEASVGLVVTSIPFANHYEYTPSYNDFGHTDDNGHFWRQMDFLTPSLLRALKPGRLACVHVKDRVLFGNVTGHGRPTISPFHAEAIFHYLRHGFLYQGMITVVTDVVRENNQTYRLGYSEMLKDGTKMGVGSPEYVLLFARPQSDPSRGYADEPVRKERAEYSLARWQIDAHAFWRSGGDRLATAEDLSRLGPDALAKAFAEWSLKGVYDFETHLRIGEALEARGALPSSFMALAPGSHDPDVWHDVNRMLTLNAAQSAKGREMHVCLARGSLVLTKRGYVPIQEVAVGDLVLTHKGRWRPVLAVRNTGVRPVVKVSAHGVPGLVLTPDHKLWARRVRDTAWARAHSRRDAERAEPDWLPAAAAQGSYVNLKLPPIEEPTFTDARLWWLVGRWLADGHRGTRGDFFVSVGRAKWAAFMEVAGPWAGTVAEKTALQVRLLNLPAAVKGVLCQCGRGAAGKALPPGAAALPVDQARALLDGYLAGDGHRVAERDRWMATSVSKPLLLGMAMLAQRAYGAIASVVPGRPGGTAIIEGRTVQTRDEWVLSFGVPSEARRKALPFINEDGAWKKVRAVEPAGEIETWNLRVDEDESYTAEGCVVKNCPLQLDIVDRLIERYSARGDLVYDPFGGLMTVPVRALRLGRRGRAAELDPGYFLDGVKYLQATEREIAVPSLFDFADGRAPERGGRNGGPSSEAA